MMQTFKVENYKGIRGVVEVSTDGGSVIVTGKNAAGKSAFIDAITELFNARGIRLTPHPINHGADEAAAELVDTELDVRVRREWGKDASGKIVTKVTVRALDGARHQNPSKVIAELTGGLILDPSTFLNLDPKPQRDALLRKVRLPFDLDAIEDEERAAEDERLQRGQAARAAEGAVTNAERPAPGTPDAPVSTAELVGELEKAREHNREVQRTADLHAEMLQEAERLDSRIASLKEQIIALEAEQTELYRRADETKVHQKLLGDLLDTTDLEARVAGVDETNRNVQIAEIRRKLVEDAEQKRAEHRAAEDAVKMIQKRKADGLRDAVFPDPHLSVSDDGVLYDGVPFSQANDASRLRAAFAIATAGDPKLPLVIVKLGDLLDEVSLAEVDRMGRERGFTVLIERGRQDTGGLIATFVEMVDGQSV